MVCNTVYNHCMEDICKLTSVNHLDMIESMMWLCQA